MREKERRSMREKERRSMREKERGTVGEIDTSWKLFSFMPELISIRLFLSFFSRI